MIASVDTRQTSSQVRQTRIGNRRKIRVAGRLTWRDGSGTLRFVSVVTRDVSDYDAFVECEMPASIPLYRLVHFQVERPARDGQDLPTTADYIENRVNVAVETQDDGTEVVTEVVSLG